MPKSQNTDIVPHIATVIHTIRGSKVILDSDLAILYGVTTKVLNQAVNRNIGRFPEEFMFQLTSSEVAALRSQFVTANISSKRRVLPYVFTEHGALMVANVLRSKQAISASIEIVRAFVAMRKMLVSVDELKEHLQHLESKYDKNFKIVFETLQLLLDEPEEAKGQWGFRAK